MDEETESNFDPREFYSKDPRTPLLSETPEETHYVNNFSNGPRSPTSVLDTPFTIVGNDQFFKDLYDYHQGRGFLCIFLTQISYILTILFSILFSTFLKTCVDWSSILDGSHKNLGDALLPYCRPKEGRQFLVTAFFLIFVSWWIFITVVTVRYLIRMWKIRKIWVGVLGLSTDMKWVTWQMVIDRYHERIDQAADSHYMVNRIMRWDNYLIALLTKDVFGLDSLGNVFTKVLEWHLRKCIMSALFRDDEILIKDVMLSSQKQEYVARLKRSLILYGVLDLVLAPFVFSAYAVYFIYRYVSEYHKNPEALGLYNFTPLAKWKLRDFNELNHVYMNRLNKAHPKIIEYLGQFVNEEYNIISKFFTFVFGAMLSILVFVSFFNPDVIISLFEVEKSVFFYSAVFGTLLVMFRNNVVDSPTVYEPEHKFDELLQILHYTPSSWANMSTRDRYQEIGRLFRLKWVVFLQEIASVVYVPFILIFWLPSRAPDIVNFFNLNSVHVDKLGVVCSCAMFDMNRPLIETFNIHQPTEDNDDDFGSQDKLTKSIEKKMTTSVMNFKEAFPTWDPQRFRRQIISNEMMDRYYDKMGKGKLPAIWKAPNQHRTTLPEGTSSGSSYHTAHESQHRLNVGSLRPQMTIEEEERANILMEKDFDLPFPLTMP